VGRSQIGSIGFVVGAVALASASIGCRVVDDGARTEEEHAAAVRAALPAARTQGAGGHVSRIFGPVLATGTTPPAASERFRQSMAATLGVQPDEMLPRDARGAVGPAGGAPGGIGLMYDAQTGQPKFWLYRYAQTRAGYPVYRGGLATLVRNGATNPVVWAASSAHDLGAFAPRAGLRARTPDAARSLQAIRGATDFSGNPLGGATVITSLSQPQLTVFAGTEEQDAAPRMAIQYTVETAPAGRWELVADADSGDVLRVQSLLVYDDIAGTVSGNVTPGDVAMECADEAAKGFPFAEVDGPSAEQAFTDPSGHYVLSDSVGGTVSLTSPMSGKFVKVVNQAGTAESLVDMVAAPGPADFLHNGANTDPLLLAQVNGYANANEIRAFLLKYLPNYPVISTQTGFTVNVNLSSAQTALCPGNAFYDGTAINFCTGSSSFTNTSFASVSHHEYGHHIIQSGGSGQGEYGEGMADTVAVLFSGNPGLAFGFFLNQCTTPIRSADNTCQFLASGCSSCGAEAHACGNLMSGTIWSIRQALAASHPDTFVDLLNSLVLSSIPLHTGTGINAQIAVDLLTLDDDDGNINNGTPHYSEICGGFSAHGMSCPPILAGLGVTPTGTSSAAGPVGGPFAPASFAYTVQNFGPEPTLQYQVSAAVPWLGVTNGAGTLAVGQSATVTVAVDQAAAAALQAGVFDTAVQFTNATDGVGSTTRAVHLEAGGPTPIFTETFEGGLGSFSLGTETGNLWHVAGAICASAQAGHSAPNSLYFGIDSTCNYQNAARDTGTATSVPITVANAAVVRLRFKYFLGTERLSPFDKATVQVSVGTNPFTIVASNNAGGTLALQDGTGQWQAAEVDISSLFAGLSSATMKVQVGFDTLDSVANNFAGFAIDDVQVLALAKTGCTTDSQCTDSTVCNGAERCVGGTCQPGTPLDCNDGNA